MFEASRKCQSAAKAADATNFSSRSVTFKPPPKNRLSWRDKTRFETALSAMANAIANANPMGTVIYDSLLEVRSLQARDTGLLEQSLRQRSVIAVVFESVGVGVI